MAGERKHTAATSPRRIFLEPACSIDHGSADQLWCQDKVWDDCEECGAPTVEYVREDIASDLLEALEGLLAVVDKMDKPPRSGGGVLPVDKALVTGAARAAIAAATGTEPASPENSHE